MPSSVFTEAYKILLGSLVAIRKDARVSQTELAARLGKTQSFVSQIERGVRRLDVIEFYAVAKALGRDPVEIFAGIAKKFPSNVSI